jgi:hypothetical protein
LFVDDDYGVDRRVDNGPVGRFWRRHLNLATIPATKAGQSARIVADIMRSYLFRREYRSHDLFAQIFGHAKMPDL